jgi:hypothetical protein
MSARLWSSSEPLDQPESGYAEQPTIKRDLSRER